MPDIEEHLLPTFPTTAVPPVDPPSSPMTIWLSSPTPDAAGEIARRSIPDGFAMNGLEASASPDLHASFRMLTYLLPQST